MSQEIEFVVEWTVKPGKLEEFKKLAKIETSAVRAKEPKARRYQWYINGEKNRFLLTECYVDSDAMLAHLKNLSPLLPELEKTADVTRFEILGNLTDEAEEAARLIHAKRYVYWVGVNR